VNHTGRTGQFDVCPVLAVQRPLAAVHFSEISIKRQHWTGDDPKLTDYQPSFVSLDSIILITEFARS